MNFKRISIILSFFSCNLNVLAGPLNKNDLSSDLKDNSDSPENVVGSSNILEDEIYDTLPIDDIDEIINVPTYNILNKIEYLGIRGKCFKFIENLYLSSKTCVKIDSKFSKAIHNFLKRFV